MARAYHEHPIFGISTLGRPVDPRFPTNKAIAILALLSFVGGAIWGWFEFGALGPAASRGAQAGLAVFLSWALGRELDPDHNISAFVAAALVLVTLVLFRSVGLWSIGLAVPLARLVNRTIGPPARHSDIAIVLLLLGAVAFTGTWAPLGVAVVAFGLDARLVDGQPSRIMFAAIAGLVLAAMFVWSGTLPQLPARPFELGALVLLGGGIVATTRVDRSECDLPGHSLHTTRVQAGVFVVLLLAITTAFEANGDWFGLAAVFVAVAVGRVVSRALPRSRE